MQAKPIELTRRGSLLGGAALLACSGVAWPFLGSGIPPLPVLNLAATTTIRDSGLLDELLTEFRRAHKIDARAVVQGTGAALMMARRGDVEALIVHDPTKENKFIADGFARSDVEFMENRFVLVGPKDTNLQAPTQDVRSVLREIKRRKIPFVSRADASGTHAAELRMWAASGHEFSTFSTPWYWESGTGMGPTLNMAVATQRATLTDIATWEYFRNKGGLVLLADAYKDPLMRNVYSFMSVNTPTANSESAEIFESWLTSPEGQSVIDSFRVMSKKVFFLTDGSTRRRNPVVPAGTT